MVSRKELAERLRETSGKKFFLWSFVSMLARVLEVTAKDGGYSDSDLCSLVLDALVDVLESEQEPESDAVTEDMGNKSSDDDCEPNTGSGGRKCVMLPVDRRGTPVDIGSRIYLAHNGKVRKVTGLTLFADGRWGVGCDSGGSFIITGYEDNVIVLGNELPSQGVRDWLDEYGPSEALDTFTGGKFGAIGRDRLLKVADEIDEAFAKEAALE